MDLGFVAEEVNQVAPLLTTLNSDGQIEGVKYDRITAVLVKGIQQQQAQIADLKTQNTSLQSQVANLQSQNAQQQMRMASLEARVFENIAAILQASGASFKEVVKVNIYLSDLANFAKLNEVYHHYFASDYPARTTIQAALPPGFLLEADVVAYVE